MAREASLYEKRPGGGVRCMLCNHYCVIGEGRRGICGVRECRDGRLLSLVFDRVVSLGVDPVEKKPLFHFLPGTLSLSLATVGCNFRCEFCQNFSISQLPHAGGPIPGDPITPEALAALAVSRGCPSISYTYTEPTVFYELTRETGLSARSKGLRNIYVTNGYMSREAIREMQDFLDAANVDLKSFSDDFYRHFCSARLEPVLDSIRALHQAGVWLEITTLVIPGRNSDPRELRQIAEFIASVDPNIPWHVSAFHPDYRMTDAPRTSAALLEKACALGEAAGLRYVYGGNIPGHPSESTRCPACRRVLVERTGFRVARNALRRPECPHCHEPVAFVLE